jgi:hypothetical protein
LHFAICVVCTNLECCGVASSIRGATILDLKSTLERISTFHGLSSAPIYRSFLAVVVLSGLLHRKLSRFLFQQTANITKLNHVQAQTTCSRSRHVALFPSDHAAKRVSGHIRATAHPGADVQRLGGTCPCRLLIRYRCSSKCDPRCDPSNATSEIYYHSVKRYPYYKACERGDATL